MTKSIAHKFYYSKSRLRLFLAVLFSALTLLIIAGIFVYKSIVPAIAIAATMAIGLFACSRLLFFLRVASKGLPAIVVDTSLLVDNMIDLKFSWTDISSITREWRRGSPIIKIHTKSKNEYIDQIKNPVVRLLYKIGLFESFVIQTNILTVDSESLYDVLVENCKAAK